MAKAAKSISYRSKNKTTCPVCRFEFAKENLHSGGGRLIAGKPHRRITSPVRGEQEIRPGLSAGVRNRRLSAVFVLFRSATISKNSTRPKSKL